jgi:hypothetical protein
MDSHIFNYCLTCKNHNDKNDSGMDIFCDKEKIMVNNYVSQKCYQNKWFKEIQIEK